MEFKDYYAILDVPRDAGQDAIKSAYRRAARKYHPDVSRQPNAEQRFKEIGEAYEVLKDPEKRAAYDRFGNQWQAGQEFHPPPGWDSGFEFNGPGFTNGGGFSEFFDTLFGGIGERARGYGAQRHGHGLRGQDHHARILVTPKEAYLGATRTVSLETPQLDASQQLVTRKRSLKVKIPRGVTAAQRIRLAGQGTPGPGGGPSGDLYLEIGFQPDPVFRIEQRDVHVELPITPWEAALGATVTAPTLAGNVQLTIPADSQSGNKLRLRGRGLPGKTPADQFVVLRIVTPRADSPRAKEFYREMARVMPMHPREDLVA